MKNRIWIAVLFAAVALVYGMTNFGGIRSPDAEVVFRAANSALDGEGLILRDPLQRWEGFGVAKGLSGDYYSIYPPGESLALIPFVHVARAINDSGWYRDRRVGVSYYVGEGFRRSMRGEVPEDGRPHSLRFLTSFFNVLVGALAVIVFAQILERLTGSRAAAIVTAACFGFASLAWTYSGTLLSEPLCTLMLLVSFWFLVVDDPSFGGGRRQVSLAAFASGIALGLAVSVHLTAILCLPFFLAYSWSQKAATSRVSRLIACGSGVALLVAALAYFNWARFGSPLQTGRSLSSLNPLVFFGPLTMEYWRALMGLMLAPGKGMVLFCPIVLAGIFAWPSLHRAHRPLSLALGGMLVVRMLFLASYMDWHGGFGLGPRYLVMIIPFALIPISFWVREQLVARRTRRLVVATCFLWGCLSQQTYFVLGEIVAFRHMVKFRFHQQGVNVFDGDLLYFSWKMSPLTGLLDGPRAPFALREIGLSNHALWLVACLLWLIVLAIGYRAMIPRMAAGERERSL